MRKTFIPKDLPKGTQEDKVSEKTYLKLLLFFASELGFKT